MPAAGDDFTKRLSAAMNGSGQGVLGATAATNGKAATPLTSAPTAVADTEPQTLRRTDASSRSASPHAASSSERESSALPSGAQAADALPVGTGEHVVRDGECISSIAKDSGHFWHTIWEDAGNALLRETRKQPNVLLPGDRVMMPPIRLRHEPGQSEMRHRFVRRGEPAHFAVRVLEQDKPRANEPFSLVVDG